MNQRLYLDNDYEVEFAMTRKNTATGASEAAAGLEGLTVLVSLTDGGTTIDSDLTVAMTERTSTPGRYYGIFDGDKLQEHLLTYVGTKVYVVFGDGTNVLTSDLYIVRATRRSE